MSRVDMLVAIGESSGLLAANLKKEGARSGPAFSPLYALIEADCIHAADALKNGTEYDGKDLEDDSARLARMGERFGCRVASGLAKIIALANGGTDD